MSDETNETIILGAGLAGLGAAYYSGYPVYEQNERPGGVAGSVSKEGYVFDYGIHVLHSKATWFHDLVEELSVKQVTSERDAWIYSHGAYASYPFQVNSSHLPLLLRLYCVASFIMRRRNLKPSNYEEWMYQNFGKGFSKTFLIPYAEKFWGVSPREMTHDWTDVRVPQPRIWEVLKGAFVDSRCSLGPNSEFRYPCEDVAGFEGLGQALAAKSKTIFYGMKVSNIDPDNKIVTFNDGGTSVKYDSLIATLPLPELVALTPNVGDSVRSAADQLRHNSIAIVNLGIKGPNLTKKHWIHFSEEDASFFRISFPHNFSTGLSPDADSSIQAEVSYDSNNPPDKDELLETVRDDLVRVRVLKPSHEVTFEDVHYVKYGYVVYDHHREDAVKTIHKFFNGHDIYPCGRYGSWEYLWADEAIQDGKATAEMILNRSVAR